MNYLIFIIMGFTLIINSCNKKGDPKPNDDNGEEVEIWDDETNYFTYVNDGLILNAADPTVIKDDDGMYYLYHTGKGYRVHSSNDLVHWSDRGLAIPDYKWAKSSFWAPEVFKRGDTYYLHYTAEPSDGIKQIGMATSSSPTGPFVDVSDQSFFKDPNNKEILDSFFFFDDDGKVYLYYNEDLNANIVGNQRYSEIHVVEVEPDLSTTIGSPVFLARPEQVWEYSSTAGQFWNEGSYVLKRNGIYYLMYSANCYCGKRYGVGFMTSDSPMGPFEKYDKNPVLSYEPYMDKVSGPGHHSVAMSPDDSEMIIVYHSHMDIDAGGGQRMINIDRMGFREDGTIYVNGPTMTEQLIPSYGAKPFISIGEQATLTAEKTNESYDVKALVDGEFSMYDRFKNYEWVSDFTSGEEIELKFEWQTAQAIEEIWFYNSIDDTRQATAARIVLNDSTEIEKVLLKKAPGEATVVSLNEPVETNTLKIFVKTGIGRNMIALSEINVFAKE